MSAETSSPDVPSPETGPSGGGMAATGPRPPAGVMTLQATLKSQYHAALAMLREAIDRCPDDLWDATGHLNPFWHIAYHTLFYTDLYLRTDEASFTPWAKHRDEYQWLGSVPGPTPRPPRIGAPYSREELLSYWRLCDEMVDSAIDRLDLTAAESGFWWYPISKLEHQLVSIRHIQHHTGQLAARVRLATGAGVPWIGALQRDP